MEFNPWEIALLLFATIGPLRVAVVAATLTAGAGPESVRRVAGAVILAIGVDRSGGFSR